MQTSLCWTKSVSLSGSALGRNYNGCGGSTAARRRQGSKAQRPIGLFWLALGAATPCAPPPPPSLPRGCKAVYALVYSSSAASLRSKLPHQAGQRRRRGGGGARPLTLLPHYSIRLKYSNTHHTRPHSTYITLSKCIHTYETAQDIN